MGLLSNLKKKKTEDKDLSQYVDLLFSMKQQQLNIKAHAIEHAADLIAKTICKSEIETYFKNRSTGKIEKNTANDIYYSLNIKPNPNERATSFFYKAIKKYLLDEEVLIVNIGDSMYVADNFQANDSILFPKIFSNVTITDEFGNSIILNRNFSMDDVIYLNLKSSNIKETLNSYYQELGTLIGIASNHYKMTNLNKFKLGIPGNQPTLRDPSTNADITYYDYKERVTRGLFDDEDSVLLLGQSMELDKLDFGQAITSDDWSMLERKWSDKVAQSFNIPLDIFNGDKTDKSTSTNDFITFGIMPHVNIIEDELNSKIIPKMDYKAGERIRINTLNMKYFDIIESATSMDKLFADGYSHNEINDIVGLPRIDEDWADKHFITKNYMSAELALKGGDGNGGEE